MKKENDGRGRPKFETKTPKEALDEFAEKANATIEKAKSAK